MAKAEGRARSCEVDSRSVSAQGSTARGVPSGHSTLVQLFYLFQTPNASGVPDGAGFPDFTEAHGRPIVIGHWARRQALLQKQFLISFRISFDHTEDLIPQPLVEVWGLKTVCVEDCRAALLGPGLLFQGLEQSAAVAVAAVFGMDPRDN
jgi:hypothetical protein